MTTTWPRYRTNCEYIGDEGQQCGYTFQHSCEQHVEHEGRTVQPYPSETFPRPGHCHSDQAASEQAPALPVKSKSAKRDRDRDRDRERGHGEHRDREHRDKEHRSSRSQEHKQQQVEELRAEQLPPPDCIDCAVSAPNGSVAAMQGIDIGYTGHGRGQGGGGEGYGTQTRSSRERDGIESGYSTQNRDTGTTRREDREKDSGDTRQHKEGRQDTVVPQPEQIQYIEGEGCQVWRPQALNNSNSLIILL